MEIGFEKFLGMCAANKIDVRTDSRQVQIGDAFIAIPGASCDGSQFIEQALANGAKYIICDKESAKKAASGDFDLIIHEDPRKAVWKLAQARWATQDLPCKIIGVTGTNGKTTSAFLLEHLFTRAGYKTGTLGTVSYHWPGFHMPAPLTTPDPLALHEMIAKMAACGVQIIIMEVSSHALSQQRAGGVSFDGAIFTNLTQDHLDFHKDMESYFRAKAKLFLELPLSNKAAAINSDDAHGRRLLELLPGAWSFGLHKNFPGRTHLEGKISRISPEGMLLDMFFGKDSWQISTHLVGEFNAYNLLGVQALGLQFGLLADDMQVLNDFNGVPGRLERIKNPLGLNIFVDYAHTPDALVNALKALRGAGFKKIVTVFGCGGNRDRTKRPLMGEAVARYADVAILTSDNPRFEDPLAILEDVKPGLATAQTVIIEPDRKKATEKALEILAKEDALLIAGKGHEDYQIIKGQKFHYSDQEVVRELTGCC